MWKEIINHPNYEINELGEIRNKTKGNLLTPFKTTNGYFRIRISNKSTYQLHYLIALHFIDNPNNYTEINHINGNKLDNFIENLEWSNRSLNMIHAYKKGLAKNSLIDKKGENNYKAKLKNEDVSKIKQLLSQNVKQIEIAKMFNVSKMTISNIKNNKSWSDLLPIIN